MNNYIELVGIVTKYKKIGIFLWVQLKDNEERKFPRFSVTFVAEEAKPIKNAIHKGAVIRVKGEVVGIDKKHNSVLVTNPVMVELVET